MGQYHKAVSLTKRERIEPHVFGQGLKQYEQYDGLFTTALYTLLVAPESRGGGDFPDDTTGVKGRWHGDRIAIVGDYADETDIPDVPGFERLYGDDENDDGVPQGGGSTDISELVRTFVIGQVYQGGYLITGTTGWQHIFEACPNHKDKLKYHADGACVLATEAKAIEWWKGYAGRVNAADLM